MEAFAKVIGLPMTANQRIDMLNYPDPPDTKAPGNDVGCKSIPLLRANCISYLISVLLCKFSSNDLSNIKKHPNKRKEKYFEL